MSHVELCPVCKGNGKIVFDSLGVMYEFAKECHGCGGRGWLELKDEQPDDGKE